MGLIQIYLLKTITSLIVGCVVILSTILYFTNIVLGYLYGYITFNIFGIDMLFVDPMIDYLTGIQIIMIVISLFLLFYVNYLIVREFHWNFSRLNREIIHKLKSRNKNE